MKWKQFYKKARSIKERGVTRSIESLVCILQDQWFDLKFGVHTKEIVSLKKLGVKSDFLENDKRARKYQATRVGAFRKLMAYLALSKENVFVDLGSGMGRILLLAMEYGFKKVVGVEISGSLCQIARENIEIYQRRHRNSTEVQVFESDVAQYEIKDDETIYFLFNPFSDQVMEKLFEKIRNSIQRNDREVWIIYNNPVHRKFFNSLDFVEKFDTFVYGGSIFNIYMHRVQSRNQKFA